MLAGTITGSHESSIYYQHAPPEADPPYVVFNKLSSTPVQEGFGPIGTAIPQVNTEVWMIQGIDRNTTADRADSIRARLDELLTDGVINISGGTSLYLRREFDRDYSEISGGVEYKHAGSEFRLTYITS
jgi:hypothetical protein